MSKVLIEELLKIEKDFDLCDELFCRLADHHGNELDVSKESTDERIVTLIWHSMGIIGNGGFQYLFEGSFNGDPGFVYTAAAYARIGSHDAADAFQKALAIFPMNNPPTNIRERLLIYQSIPETQRNEIDKQFWHANADIESKLAIFIRSHTQSFQHL